MKSGEYLEVKLNNIPLCFYIDTVISEERMVVRDPSNGNLYYMTLLNGAHWSFEINHHEISTRQPLPGENEKSYWTDPKYAGNPASDSEDE